MMAEEKAADQELIDRLHKEAEEHDKWAEKERKRLIKVAAENDTFEPEGINMRNFFDEIQEAKSGKQKKAEAKEAEGKPIVADDPATPTFNEGTGDFVKPSEVAAEEPKDETVVDKVKSVAKTAKAKVADAK